MSTSETHWHASRDGGGLEWLALDRADAGTNTLSRQVLEELAAHVSRLESDAPAGLVLYSGKDNGFIAGADVGEFSGIGDEAEAREHIARVHELFSRIEALPFPTVAAIHGFCLGGGLELSLACRYRVATDEPSTRIGLPEVLLGIHPGFGGSVRCIERIGVPAAMDMMLSGRTHPARRAAALGLIDHAVPLRHLLGAAATLLRERPAQRRPRWWLRALNHRLARPWLARYLRRQVSARAAQKHYPAPYALIELWERHGDDRDAMLREEARSVARLVTGYTARNLVRVFFLQEKLKAQGRMDEDGSKDDTGAGEPEDAAPPAEVRRVHVVGAGVMGGDIATWCVLQGLHVTVQDTSTEALSGVVRRGDRLFRKRLRDPRRVRAAMDRLVPDERGAGAAHADLVIEAIFEDVEAKRSLFREIEARAEPGTLLATNTSSIPLEDIGSALTQPGRLLGLHFFNPVEKMQLVEVVRGDNTSRREWLRGCAFARQISRLPVPVSSRPGFLVNRVLSPYLLEAVKLLEEGVPGPVIDREATAFGMPVGPVELADSVGLDICLSVAENLAQTLGLEVPQRLRRKVERGNLGRKTGRGFYTWSKGKPRKDKPAASAGREGDVRERLILSMLNTAVACLREGIVADEDLLDAGLVFGTGFAPFHGGPMHYVRHQGVRNVHDRLRHLAATYGERFTPDPGWDDLQAPATGGSGDSG